MNTIAIFASAFAATIAFVAGFAAIGSSLIAFGLLAGAFGEYSSRRTVAVAV